MNRNVLSFMESLSMTAPGDHVICAVSGGKDSMALLHLMLSLRETLSITVSAAHFNHQLRGEESQRDEDFVTAQCQALGVPLSIGRGDVGRYGELHHMGLEEAARTLRYDFFGTLSSGAKIATAHTAEDNLETLLLRLLRGCSLHGLSSIPPVRGCFIRPLLLTERREIDQFLSAHSIPYVEDSSNRQDAQLRNRIRHHVLPLLLRENPSLPRSASKLCMQLGQEDHLLSELAAWKLKTLQDGNTLSCDRLSQLPEAMALRVLALFLAPVPEIGKKHLEAVRALCGSSSPSAQISLPEGYCLRRVYDKLVLEKPCLQAVPQPVQLFHGQQVRFGPYTVCCRMGPAPQVRESGTLALEPEKVRLPLTLQSRRSGDVIRLPGGTKKLSDLMIDEKIPAALRKDLPVVVQDGEVLALLPLRAAAAYCVKPGHPALLLTIKETEVSS